MLQEFVQSGQQPHKHDLELAFNHFNQVSDYLTEVFRELETRVSSLNSELSNERDERSRQLEEKERLANRLQNLLAVLPAGVVVLDHNGYVTEHNPAALDLLGEPLLKQAWRDIVERSFTPRWDDGHDVTLADNRSVNISTQALDDNAGQLILLKEVTETRQLQQQLGRLKRLSAMGEMASSLAHQIRTPLSSALLYASNIQHSMLDASRRNRFTGKLIGRLQHLEKLVEDMLLFARGGNFDAKQQDLGGLLEQFRESVDTLLASSKARLEIECPDELEVRVNSHAFISILQNLLNNAIEASDERACIQLGVTRTDENYLNLEFADNGRGIAVESQSHVFEPFYTTRAEGSGLGLAVADSVIRSHGGQISLAASNEQGTTFLIQLPLAGSQ